MQLALLTDARGARPNCDGEGRLTPFADAGQFAQVLDVPGTACPHSSCVEWGSLPTLWLRGNLPVLQGKDVPPECTVAPQSLHNHWRAVAPFCTYLCWPRAPCLRVTNTVYLALHTMLITVVPKINTTLV